jgi:hypothetical protein
LPLKNACRRQYRARFLNRTVATRSLTGIAAPTGLQPSTPTVAVNRPSLGTGDSSDQLLLRAEEVVVAGQRPRRDAARRGSRVEERRVHGRHRLWSRQEHLAPSRIHPLPTSGARISRADAQAIELLLIPGIRLEQVEEQVG